MFKSRYLTPEQVDEFYREALTRYERIVLQAHLNRIAASVNEELPDEVRARMIMSKIQRDWAETGDEP